MSFKYLRYICIISIHAPARGATLLRPIWKRACNHFNPRSRTGSDYTVSDFDGYDSLFQSTLPHGERLFCSLFAYCQPIYFNPRSRTGSDVIFPARQVGYFGFQSTLPHGERRIFFLICCKHHRYFNPRSRTGSDDALRDRGCIHAISIHAPARGATSKILDPNVDVEFQSTLPHGERQYFRVNHLKIG